MPLNEQMARTCSLAAAHYKDKIFLFGGGYGTSYKAYILSEEAEFEEDLSEDVLIPGVMNLGSHLVWSEKIIAVGWTGKRKGEWSLRVFNGKNWE